MMKFAMGSETLTQLSQKTSGAGDDLGALVRQLADAAAPLEEIGRASCRERVCSTV